jgi:hypothetical protein
MPILGLVILSLLVPGLHRLASDSRPKSKSVPAGSHRISRIARVSKTPKSHSIDAGPLATVDAETDLDRRNEGIGQIVQSVSDAALTQVVLGSAGTDLNAALDWVRTLPEDGNKEAVTLYLAYEAALTDPVEALEVAGSLEPTSQRDDLLVFAISQWATTDFAAAVQWADQDVMDPSLRQRLLAAVAVAAAGQDGTAAATLAATTLESGEEQNRAAIAIVQRWAQYEPEAAASWVAQFPDTPTRETAAQNLLALWAAQDNEAAGNWLRALPQGTLSNVGMNAYARSLPGSERP